MTTATDLSVWFDPDSNIEPQLNGTLSAKGGTQFRGKFKQGRCVQIETGKRIEWEWPVHDIPTKVTWQIENHGNESKLIVTHQVEKDGDKLAPPRDGAGVIFHFWKQNLACLKYYLDAKGTPSGAQFGELPETSVNVSLKIPLSTKELWQYFTVPKHLDNWITTEAKVELRKEGVFSFGWDHGAEKLIQFENEKFIEFNWWNGDQETVVRWDIEPTSNPSESIARIRHTKFGPEFKVRMQSYHEGWLTFLHMLGVYSVTGERLSDWYGDA